uniref:Uncharacterized protein n=1 Tax=Rhizophora mucronata TaxID=61149 RepID=A0A2P2P661_RHIMU
MTISRNCPMQFRAELPRSDQKMYDANMSLTSCLMRGHSQASFEA